MKKTNLFLILSISLVIVLARLLPYVNENFSVIPPNFSPLASVILFAAVYSQNKKYLVFPFLALFASDLMIGFYHALVMISVYGSFVLILMLGRLLKNNKNIINTISASLGGALIFFLLTNFAVWYSSSWYSHDLAGLALCYNLAIPFFKNTLMSNLLYTGLLFGLYESSAYFIREKKIIWSR